MELINNLDQIKCKCDTPIPIPRETRNHYLDEFFNHGETVLVCPNEKCKYLNFLTRSENEIAIEHIQPRTEIRVSHRFY